MQVISTRIYVKKNKFKTGYIVVIDCEGTDVASDQGSVAGSSGIGSAGVGDDSGSSLELASCN